MIVRFCLALGFWHCISSHDLLQIAIAAKLIVGDKPPRILVRNRAA